MRDVHTGKLLKDEPAKVKATGKPNNKNNKVVRNIIIANISGVI